MLIAICDSKMAWESINVSDNWSKVPENYREKRKNWMKKIKVLWKKNEISSWKYRIRNYLIFLTHLPYSQCLKSTIVYIWKKKILSSKNAKQTSCVYEFVEFCGAGKGEFFYFCVGGEFCYFIYLFFAQKKKITSIIVFIVFHQCLSNTDVLIFWRRI